jgi:hypothetical protein
MAAVWPNQKVCGIRRPAGRVDQLPGLLSVRALSPEDHSISTVETDSSAITVKTMRHYL